MKEQHLSKTPFLTLVYISKCTINLPGYFGNSKKKVFVNRSSAHISMDANVYGWKHTFLRPITRAAEIVRHSPDPNSLFLNLALETKLSSENSCLPCFPCYCSQCSQCSPKLLHVLPSGIVGQLLINAALPILKCN